MSEAAQMETIWEVPDELWERLECLLNEEIPPKDTGRPRANLRSVLNGIIFRLRSGCQWNRLPKDYGDDSTIHRHFQSWVELGIFEKIWAVLVEACDELGAVQWRWQAADCALGKARFGGDEIGPNPTDRAKKGTKRSILVDEKGGP